MTATIPELLARDLLSWAPPSADGVARRVLLWVDPNAEFSRLWPWIKACLERADAAALLCDRETDDQLRLKIALLKLEGGSISRAVVYLPGFDNDALKPRLDGSPPGLWSVFEYRFKGCVWGGAGEFEPGAVPPPPSLAGWLRRHGIRFADGRAQGRLSEGGQGSLLSRCVERWKERPPAEWPRPLRESDVLQALGGDPRDALRSLIAAPTNAMRMWGEEASLALAGIADRFGLALRENGATPGETADAFALQLALTEAWDAFGRPGDFPFRSRLPAKVDQRDRAVAFLRTDVLQDKELGPRYRERLLRLESQCDLSNWASGRSGQPRGLPLLARKRWSQFLERFDALAKEDWKTACRMLIESSDAIGAGRSTPWDGLNGDTQWLVLEDLASLRRLAVEARAEAQRLVSAAELISRYANQWWTIDRLHLHLRAACVRTGGLEQVRRVADLVYFEYVEVVNDRFAGLVEEESTWPPIGARGVESLREELWTLGRGRKAIVVTDGLRLDLAGSLAETLPVELTTVVATLPTTTPFGMTIFLPLEQAYAEVSFDPGATIRVAGSGNLATRQGRKELLESRLGQRNGMPAVGFADMDDILRGGPVPVQPIVVVFDNTIDEQGHKGTEELPGLAEQLISKLRRTVERLHDAGVPDVHVVTDHGFLLLPADMVNDLGKPPLPPIQVLRKEQRWAALKPGAPVSGLISLPLPLAPSITLGLPRGVRTLMVSEDYLHGGVSLQETVLPHVVSRNTLKRSRPQVQVLVTTDHLYGGTVPVVLRPTVAEQSSFGEQPITVLLWVEAELPGAEELIHLTEHTSVEVRPGARELKPPMYLKEGLDLHAGQELRLRAVEKDTGQDLATIGITLAVDWE